MIIDMIYKIIGEKECLDETILITLEIASIIHDIACPLCREKYGNTHGKYQEIEGMLLKILNKLYLKKHSHLMCTQNPGHVKF